MVAGRVVQRAEMMEGGATRRQRARHRLGHVGRDSFEAIGTVVAAGAAVLDHRAEMASGYEAHAAIDRVHCLQRHPYRQGFEVAVAVEERDVLMPRCLAPGAGRL